MGTGAARRQVRGMDSQAVPSDYHRLIASHLRLASVAVAQIAPRLPAHVDRDELHSAALLGLTQAARTYCADRGVAFAAYARPRIRGALLDELRSLDWASRPVRQTARRVAEASAALSASLGRTPTDGELAAHTGLDVDHVRRSAADVHRAAVLNWEALAPDGDLGELLPGAEPCPQDALLDREQLAYLHDAVAALPERLRVVVVGYFFEDRPMTELAEQLGVTPSRVSQLRGEALEWLRSALDAALEGGKAIPSDQRGCRAARMIAEYTARVGRASDFAARLTDRPAVLGPLAA